MPNSHSVPFTRISKSLRCFLIALCLVPALVLGLRFSREAFAVGDLDSTFGTGGVATTDINSSADSIAALAIQTDGKIVTAGYALNGATSYDFALARYNTDGTLDTSFGTLGKVTVDFATHRDQAYGLALQSDGKIVVAGTATPGSADCDLAVARFNTNGTLDTGFGTGGKVTTSLGSADDEFRAVVIQSDGKIVAAGLNSLFNANSNFAVVRYNTNGTLDTGFGTGGIVAVDGSTTQDEANAVALTTGGKILVTGKSVFTNPSAVATFTVQLNTDGSLDTSFGTSGKRVFRVGNSDDAKAILVQPDGKFLLGGSSNSDTLTGDNFALYRFNANGTSDTSFGSGGAAITNIYGNNGDAIRSLALQSDGKIVAAGRSAIDLAVARFNSDGSLDAKIKLDPFGFEDEGRAVALQSDGKIVVGGEISTTGTSAGADFGLVRLVSLTTVRPHLVPGDFDGDGKTDVAVYRPSNGVWYALNSSNGAFVFLAMTANVAPAPGDFDGDGKTDFATYAASNGGWNFRNSSTGTNSSYVLSSGSGVDKPVAGDYNGNGKSEATIYTPTANWTGLVELPATGGVRNQQFGAANDLPVRGDYDGDGQVDIAVFRPSNGNWYILRSSNGTLVGPNWGISTDRPVPGDYDGDGRTDVAVWRPSDGNWYVLLSSNGSLKIQQWGGGSFGDIPVPGDYDGDGKYDFAVFRNGTWYWLNSSTNSLGAVQFGQTGDVPAPATYIP